MKLEKQQHVQGTSREAEEKHLKETLDVIHANMESYGAQVQTMREDIDEMLEHFHDDNPELINLLENTITLHDHMKRALERNAKAQNKPYFGRIIFYDKALGKTESLYIGRGGIAKDHITQAVIDWRAPIANAYYENGLGICSYTAPNGDILEIDLHLKRTYEIEQGVLKDYFDSEVISNDELLTKYLAKNKQAVLGEIVATIQQEQNEIIRRTPFHNIIIQGVAGSGKTTVAMHRISYILYNYAERFKPADFYIVGSNRILLNYITGVLPDLDVHGVKQMTMEELFIRLLYEDWHPQKYSIKKGAQNSDKGRIKGTDQWFYRLQAYCDKLEETLIPSRSIYLNPKQFVEGFQDGKTGVFDRSTGNEKLILLVDSATIKRYIKQNPNVSVQSKINMLNERLAIKIKEEFLYRGVKYTEAERKAIKKAYRNYYGSKEWKRSTFDIYRTFIKEQIENGAEVEMPDKEFDVYDLAALAYIYKRTKETEVISEAHHIVIDEAQDFGMMAYQCLHFCITGCTYTIMGDVSQNIHFGFGLNDWEGLKRLILSDPMDNFGLLKKSYRNTVEISNFATDILHHGKFVHYPVEPIIRHGNPVEVKETTIQAIWKDAAAICTKWQKNGFQTIAIVCRTDEDAVCAVNELKPYLTIMESDLEKAEFGNGIMVLPVEYTKGLEFDAVLILNPSKKDYPSDDGHAKLLYVAATRALHELSVLHTDDLTGLIADPVPEDSKLFAIKENTHPAQNVPKPTAKSDLSQNGFVPKKKSRVSIVTNSSTPENTKKTSRNITNTYAENTVKQPQKPILQTEASPKPSINKFLFGDMPATQLLRPIGHTKIDLSIRWVMKQPDGLYLQSRFGVLRLSPVSSGIIRVTFAKGSKIADITHPFIEARRIERYWTYKESSKTVELTTDELILCVNKNTGAISFFTRNKNLLLSERANECRQIENTLGKTKQVRLYLERDKNEKIYAVGAPGEKLLSLRDSAHYICRKGNLPLIFSEKGYGIVVASDSPVISCDIPTYGTFLLTENQEQMDYYFIASRNAEILQKAYQYLTGTL